MASNAIQISTDPDPNKAFKIAQAYRVGDLIFLSGQAALDLEGNLVGIGNFEVQAEQAFENLRAVLQAGGSDLDKIIKLTIFVKDMANFPTFVELRARYFSEPWPASDPGTIPAGIESLPACSRVIW